MAVVATDVKFYGHWHAGWPGTENPEKLINAIYKVLGTAGWNEKRVESASVTGETCYIGLAKDHGFEVWDVVEVEGKQMRVTAVTSNSLEASIAAGSDVSTWTGKTIKCAGAGWTTGSYTPGVRVALQAKGEPSAPWYVFVKHSAGGVVCVPCKSVTNDTYVEVMYGYDNSVPMKFGEEWQDSFRLLSSRSGYQDALSVCVFISDGRLTHIGGRNSSYTANSVQLGAGGVEGWGFFGKLNTFDPVWADPWAIGMGYGNDFYGLRMSYPNGRTESTRRVCIDKTQAGARGSRDLYIGFGSESLSWSSSYPDGYGTTLMLMQYLIYAPPSDGVYDQTSGVWIGCMPGLYTGSKLPSWMQFESVVGMLGRRFINISDSYNSAFGYKTMFDITGPW